MMPSEAGAPPLYWVTVSYPRTPELRFDTDYYLNRHMASVERHWAAYGLRSWSVVEYPEGDASGLHTQAVLLWDSEAAFRRAWDAQIPELMDDLPNYSNLPPVQAAGKVLKQSSS